MRPVRPGSRGSSTPLRFGQDDNSQFWGGGGSFSTTAPAASVQEREAVLRGSGLRLGIVVVDFQVSMISMRWAGVSAGPMMPGEPFAAGLAGSYGM